MLEIQRTDIDKILSCDPTNVNASSNPSVTIIPRTIGSEFCTNMQGTH